MFLFIVTQIISSHSLDQRLTDCDEYSPVGISRSTKNGGKNPAIFCEVEQSGELSFMSLERADQIDSLAFVQWEDKSFAFLRKIICGIKYSS